MRNISRNMRHPKFHNPNTNLGILSNGFHRTFFEKNIIDTHRGFLKVSTLSDTSLNGIPILRNALLGLDNRMMRENNFYIRTQK